MYFYGTTHIHAAQPLSAPHRTAAAQSVGANYRASGVDQLDISPEADLISQVHDLPEVRADRVAQIKAQIQNGSYDTADKLDMALSRLLDEIA
jgi:negative regulator of flagellin synthesis FlgM